MSDEVYRAPSLRYTEPAAWDLPERPAWFAQGACLGLDPAMFFPERGEDTRPAKATCASCDVRQQCLEYSIEEGEDEGIWGGLTANQRRGMRGSRRSRLAAEILDLHERRPALPLKAIAEELGCSYSRVRSAIAEARNRAAS